MKQTDRFRHESLQDRETIARLLEALTKGLSQGKVTLEDDGTGMVMEPSGLLNLKIAASKDDDYNKLTLRVTWQGARKASKGKPVKIKSG